MAYFEAINENGIYQVEDGSVTMGLVQVSTPSFGAGTRFKSATVTYSGNADSNPVVVIYVPASTNGSMALSKTAKSGNNWTFYFDIACDLSSSFGSLTGIRVLIFDRPAPLANGAGVEFYDVNGKLQWSSSKKSLKIVGLQGSVFPTGTYGALVGGAEYITEVDYEQLTTMDWQVSTTKILEGPVAASTGINLLESRYEYSENIGGQGGSNTVTTTGVTQPIYVVDIAGYI